MTRVVRTEYVKKRALQSQKFKDLSRYYFRFSLRDHSAQIYEETIQFWEMNHVKQLVVRVPSAHTGPTTMPFPSARLELGRAHKWILLSSRK